MAADMYMQERVSHAPSIDGYNTYSNYQNGQNPIPIIQRSPSSFLPVTDDETPSKKRTYEICLEAAVKYPGKRRLVSLFEANEVAKRLARMKAQSQALALRKGEDVVIDEVSEWIVNRSF
jgi:hypothetical protein